jgi:glycosyltransferase involved in cell wall biosynthesis
MCTIAARNYLPSVALLVESFTRHHPEVPVSVLVVDGTADDTSTGLPFEVLLPSHLRLSPDEFGRMATYYDVTELSTALKPFLLELLLDRGDETVMYLDPDIEVYAPLDDLFTAARDSSIALTPHVTEPVPRDGMSFTEEALLLSGQFNLGFVAVSANARPFLEYWQERTRRYAVREVGEGYFTDQRWVDAVPTLFEHVVIRDRGCNVAYWNLHERPIVATEEGWTAGDVPLRFFHFSGHHAATPYTLSSHLDGIPRVQVHEQDDLRGLLAARAERLLTHQTGSGPLPYRFDRTATGLRLDHAVRRLYWREVAVAEARGELPPPHAFGPDGGRSFLQWLREPAGAHIAVPRHLFSVWQSRPDLQHAFPDLGGQDAQRLVEWAAADAHHVAQTPVALRVRVGSQPLPGVNLVGYLEGEFGVGAAARMVGRIMRASGLPMATSVLRPEMHRHHASFASGVHGAPFSLTVLAMNADALLGYATSTDFRAYHATKRVGIWYWEVGVLPEHLRPAFDLVDEVWCASEYVREALAPFTDVPVLVHPLAMPPHVPTALERGDVGLPEGRFVIGFAFDYASVVRRKNPAGVIRAYCDAFGPSDGAALVLKSVNARSASAQAAELRELAAGRDDIVFLERHFDELEMAAFFQHLDAYVSLHRSEGLGLTMGAAMAAGVPVVATGWSGNCEFMDDGAARLVPFELVDVGAGAAPYPSNAKWAEPDLGAASAHLRELFEDRGAARDLGRRGQAAMFHYSDKERAGRWFKERFEVLTGTVLA